jgi:hypothetical protein
MPLEGIQKASTNMRTYSRPSSILFVTLALAASGFGQNQSGFTAAPSSNPNPPHAGAQRENYDPLLDLPPLPNSSVTLMGGVVVNTNEVMNRMTFQPFGTRERIEVHFDTRTHFYLDGKPITEREMQRGQRIYLDTMLNHERVFARSIWIRSTAESGMGRGQIISYDPQRKLLTVHDELSNQPVKLQMTATTAIRKENQPGTVSDLTPGALVSIDFGAQRDLRAITVLATPGSVFTFAGLVSYVDVSQKLIAIDNRSDGKKYDVHMDAIAPSVLHQVREGQDVNVSAVFEGDRYSARNIDFTSANSSQPK